jgi:hypothetical protein
MAEEDNTEETEHETLDQILSSVPSGTLMAAFHHVRTLRSGDAYDGPRAPEWAAPVVAALVDTLRDERGAADPLLAAQQWLGSQLQLIAQAALREAHVYQDGDCQVWEGTLPSGFRTVGELKSFALGRSYALVVAPGAAEPPSENDRRITERAHTAWHCAKPGKGAAQ